jgi:hypothetical protein
MIVGEIAAENVHKMALVEDSDVIQARPVDATDNALDFGVLPRAPRCDGTLFHSQTANALMKALSIDGITITQQVFRRCIRWSRSQLRQRTGNVSLTNSRL